MFEDEGFSQGTPATQVSGRGRELIERYYATVDWSSGDDIDRVLRVFERNLSRAPRSWSRGHCGGVAVICGGGPITRVELPEHAVAPAALVDAVLAAVGV